MIFQPITRVSLCSVICLVLSSIVLQAQDRQGLEQERLAIIERIEQADKALAEVSSNKKKSIRDFRLLERKIKDREKLISTIQRELILSEEALSKQQAETSVLQTDLEQIKERYYAMLNIAYKQHHSYNKWAFIFNASSINDSYQRWKYIKQYEAYCKREYEALEEANKEVLHSIESLNLAVQDRQALLDQESGQFELIQQELILKESIIASLKDQESELKQELQQQKIARERLNAAIEQYIIAALQGNEPVEQTSELEGRSIERFENVKGRLYWPVSSAYIISEFGRQKHPSISGVYINNNGIDIASNQGDVAMAVHAGEVVGISEIPGFGWTVILKHEDYYTVYSKLRNVSVSDKQFIKQGTQIGNISVDESGQPVLHFEVWKGKQKLNPSGWLKKKQ